jgi:hypothetical protein
MPGASEKLRFQLEVVDGYPPVAVENLFVSRMAPGRYVLESLPFFFREATLGDEILVWEVGDDRHDASMLKRGSNGLLRVFVSDCDRRAALADRLSNSGVIFEVLPEYGLVSVNTVSCESHSELVQWLLDFCGMGAVEEVFVCE